MKYLVISILLSAIPRLSFCQSCNCESNFQWVKKTFEENDAGFRYVIATKGNQAYLDHNKRFSEKFISVKSLTECASLLKEWLTFFRSGHISINVKEDYQDRTIGAISAQQYKNWETIKTDTNEFKAYLDKKNNPGFEGIWGFGNYKIGIQNLNNRYIGFIVESSVDTWAKGQIKLKFNINKDSAKSVFYMRDHSAVESNYIEMDGKNHLKIGENLMIRIYPHIEDEPSIASYYKLINAQVPYLEELNPTTLYFRIPSFEPEHKKEIDSVINANKEKILSTKNLILDIRNGTGGNDNSFEELIPLLYTNPIRTVGVEYFSSKLNNQRMLDLITKPEYGLSESVKKWAQKAYDTLEKHLGEFVNLNTNPVGVEKRDTIYKYPQSIGIIIDKGNASSDEQFLLAAKQSKKVKLFGTTTFGILDISNMYFVESPCKEFELGYALSRSMRIPDFTIDGKGIQPDYFFDRSISKFRWVEQVNDILNE